MKHSKFFVLSSAIVILLDQITKYFASGISAPILVIGDFFTLNLVHNTGAGFGLFKDSVMVLSIISFIVIAAIIYYYPKIPTDKRTQLFFALILGGAIGNLIDRIMLGYVVDFLSFSFWPAFNIADSAVTIGAVGLIVYELKKG